MAQLTRSMTSPRMYPSKCYHFRLSTRVIECEFHLMPYKLIHSCNFLLPHQISQLVGGPLMPMNHSQSSQGNRLTRPVHWFTSQQLLQEFQPLLGDPIPCRLEPDESFTLSGHLTTTIILGF